MKGKIFLLAAILMFVALSEIAMGQPPPPPPSGGHGINNNQPAGAGAPVGSGVIILITLSAAYGTKKMYNARRKKMEI
jgi:hypothetical protein